MLPLTDRSRCCGRIPLSGHSLQARNLDEVELTVCGTKLPSVKTGSMAASKLCTRHRLSSFVTRNLQTTSGPILFSIFSIGGIAIRFVSVLILVMSFGDPVLAQTPAETNPEARHISQNHGVPQPNGRLLLTGSGYEDISVREQLGAINLAWRNYSATFRIPEKGLRDLIPYFKRNPGLFRQLLAENTRATPEVSKYHG